MALYREGDAERASMLHRSPELQGGLADDGKVE
jgi:hypothetical protein